MPTGGSLPRAIHHPEEARALALVSSLYALAPSPPWTREESDRRVRLLLRRLVARHEVDEVVRRVRAGVSDDEMRVRLIVLAESVGRGQRQASV